MRWRFVGAAVLLLALVPTAQLAWNWRSMPHLGIYHDDSLYFVAAHALANGDGYRIESMPGEPVQTKYPPLFPLLLSAVWRVNPEFPSNLALATLLCWLALPLTLTAAWRLFGVWELYGWRRVLLCVWIALSPVVALFSVSMMAELLFCVLLTLAVTLAERARNGRMAFGAGAVGALAYLARAAASPLIITAPLIFLWRRQWRQATAFVAAMAPVVVVWQVWQRTNVQSGGDLTLLYHTKYAAFYLATLDWSQLPSRMFLNLNTMVNGMGQLILFGEQQSAIQTTVARLVTVAAVVGSVRLARRTGAFHYLAYGLVYTLLLVLWHFPPDARFMLPLLPLLLAGFLEMYSHLASLVWAAARGRQAVEKFTALAFGLALVLFPVCAGWQMWHGFSRFLPQLLGTQRQVLAENLPAYRWVSTHTPPDAQFYADDSALFYLYTNRRALDFVVPTGPMYEGNSAAVTDYLAGFPAVAEQHKLDYALVTPSDFRLQEMALVQPAWRRMMEDESQFQALFQQGGVTVFRLGKDAGGKEEPAPRSL